MSSSALPFLPPAPPLLLLCSSSFSSSYSAGWLPAGCYWPTPETGPDQGWAQQSQYLKCFPLSLKVLNPQALESKYLLLWTMLVFLLLLPGCAHPCIAWRAGGG